MCNCKRAYPIAVLNNSMKCSKIQFVSNKMCKRVFVFMHLLCKDILISLNNIIFEINVEGLE